MPNANKMFDTQPMPCSNYLQTGLSKHSQTRKHQAHKKTAIGSINLEFRYRTFKEFPVFRYEFQCASWLQDTAS